MRATGQNAPRRDIPGIACEEVRDFLRIAQVLRVTKNAPMEDLQEKYRQLIHIRETTLRGIQHDLNQYNEDEWRRKLRVKRLVGEIDDSTWKDRLQRKEKAFYKQNAWYQLLDMYTRTGLEMFGRITLMSTPVDIDDVKNQLKQLNEYVSNECNAISKVYGCVIPSEFAKW